MRIRTIGLVLGASLLCQLLTAQETEHNTEDLHSQGDIRTMMIKAEAESSDRDFKMSALEKIASMVEDGSASDNTEIVDVLSYLAGESVSNVARERGYVLNDYPEIRRESVRLLGLIGSERAVYELERVLLHDPEPMVASEAILAIAQIDIENRAQRDRLIYRAIHRQTALTKDNSFASSFLRSVEIMIQRDGNRISPSILAEVVRVGETQSGYNYVVRRQANELLRSLQDS